MNWLSCAALENKTRNFNFGPLLRLRPLFLNIMKQFLKFFFTNLATQFPTLYFYFLTLEVLYFAWKYLIDFVSIWSLLINWVHGPSNPFYMVRKTCWKVSWNYRISKIQIRFHNFLGRIVFSIKRNVFFQIVSWDFAWIPTVQSTA